MAVRTERLLLAPEPRAAGEARRFARQVLSEANLPPEVRDVVILLTSETVTNAVLHGRGDVSLTVTVGPGALRVEVGDDGGCWPLVRHVHHSSADGRGLAMVESEASRWGVEGRGSGKVVWFELLY